MLNKYKYYIFVVVKLLRKILFPIVPIYYLVTWLRNKLFDLNIKKSVSYDFPIICVGNLSTGGTGKTPMIEYLIRLLKDDYKVAALSRGYKRKSEGFQLGDEKSNADILGDEPFQFYTKFKNEAIIAVDVDRNNGIKNLLVSNSSPNVILLDDAFQHRKVKAGFNIMLTTYSNLYTLDIVLPTGDLREPRSGAKRADIIIITKCPFDISDNERNKIIAEMKPETNQNIFFSDIQYSVEVENETKSLKLESLPTFTLITGIADPIPLRNFLESKSLNFEHLIYKDHYNFSEEDIKIFENKELLITTEKDFMRLKKYNTFKHKLFYLPITVVIDNETKLNNIIKTFVNSF